MSTPISTMEPEYQKPLYFDVVNHGVQLLPLQLEYNLETGSQLELGNFLVNENSFRVKIDDWANQETGIFIKWPRLLIQPNIFEVIGRTGDLLYSRELTEYDSVKWSEKLKEIKKQQKDLKLEAKDLKPESKVSSKAPPEELNDWNLKDAQLGVPIASEVLRSLKKSKEPFRFCLGGETDVSLTRFCSPYFQLTVEKSAKTENSKIKWEKIFSKVGSPRVIAFHKEAPLKDLKQVSEEHPVQFFAELSTGETYEFVARPRRFDLVEIMDLPKEKKIRITAFGSQPTLPVTLLNKEKENYFSKLFRWRATIGDFRKFWEVKLPRDKNFIYIQGVGAGLFKQEFVISFLPTEDMTPFVDQKTVSETYVDGVKIFGQMQNSHLTIYSEENEVFVDENNEFTWKFKAQNKGEMNKSYLEVTKGKNTFKSFHEIYRGFPGEISARLGLFLGSGKQSSLSTSMTYEFSFQYWFEDIFGWTDYYLARQRWGVSFKGHRSANQVKIGDILPEASPQTQTVDLKYRLEPGLWNHDESWGLLVSYLDFTFPSTPTLQAKMLGAGFFWARSMPQVFDDLFNLLWLMKYPKYVDLEFIYYPKNLNKEITMTQFSGLSGSQLGNWALNFHGKVMWTKQFFGEGGFGVKNISFKHKVDIASDDPTIEKVTNLSFSYFTLYGSIGLGWSF